MQHDAGMIMACLSSNGSQKLVAQVISVAKHPKVSVRNRKKNIRKVSAQDTGSAADDHHAETV